MKTIWTLALTALIIIGCKKNDKEPDPAVDTNTATTVNNSSNASGLYISTKINGNTYFVEDQKNGYESVTFYVSNSCFNNLFQTQNSSSIQDINNQHNDSIRLQLTYVIDDHICNTKPLLKDFIKTGTDTLEKSNSLKGKWKIREDKTAQGLFDYYTTDPYENIQIIIESVTPIENTKKLKVKGYINACTFYKYSISSFALDKSQTKTVEKIDFNLEFESEN